MRVFFFRDVEKNKPFILSLLETFRFGLIEKAREFIVCLKRLLTAGQTVPHIFP